MAVLIIIGMFIIIVLIGVLYKLNFIIEELEKLTGGEGGFTGGKKTFRERLEELKEKRKKDG